MKALVASILLVAAAVVAGAWSPQPEPRVDNTMPAATTTEFLAYDVVIDAGSEPLSAWQVEVKDTLKHARIVGIEGGQPGPYSGAPHYDPKAIQGEHVIIGAFTTKDAPTGKVRVARLHVMAEGGTPSFTTTITAAAPGGRAFNATLTIQPHTPDAAPGAKP
ncbi:MAG TPA: hypothetical protein VD997_03615 [Phycisphaerales bacterium]|nr:hypothetical protein [Phycisphaerales bacterium]